MRGHSVRLEDYIFNLDAIIIYSEIGPKETEQSSLIVASV